mmetsp:Transcript_23788/g.63753  ORF Transcript_23788/g.63753 Transcript_23788/m.63753 type:complete len:514 (+) Transcript_23788:426-1967(+)
MVGCALACPLQVRRSSPRRLSSLRIVEVRGTRAWVDDLLVARRQRCAGWRRRHRGRWRVPCGRVRHGDLPRIHALGGRRWAVAPQVDDDASAGHEDHEHDGGRAPGAKRVGRVAARRRDLELRRRHDLHVGRREENGCARGARQLRRHHLRRRVGAVRTWVGDLHLDADRGCCQSERDARHVHAQPRRHRLPHCQRLRLCDRLDRRRVYDDVNLEKSLLRALVDGAIAYGAAGRADERRDAVADDRLSGSNVGETEPPLLDHKLKGLVAHRGRRRRYRRRVLVGGARLQRHRQRLVDEEGGADGRRLQRARPASRRARVVDVRDERRRAHHVRRHREAASRERAAREGGARRVDGALLREGVLALVGDVRRRRRRRRQRRRGSEHVDIDAAAPLALIEHGDGAFRRRRDVLCRQRARQLVAARDDGVGCGHGVRRRCPARLARARVGGRRERRRRRLKGGRRAAGASVSHPEFIIGGAVASGVIDGERDGIAVLDGALAVCTKRVCAAAGAID